MERIAQKEVCLKSPNGKCWLVKITDRGALIVEGEVPDAKDAASRDYANYQAILEKAWSTGIGMLIGETAVDPNNPTQAEIDAAKLQFEDYVDTHENEVLKFKIGKQERLQTIWADTNDNPFSQAIVDALTLILAEDPNA